MDDRGNMEHGSGRWSHFLIIDRNKGICQRTGVLPPLSPRSRGPRFSAGATFSSGSCFEPRPHTGEGGELGPATSIFPHVCSRSRVGHPTHLHPLHPLQPHGHRMAKGNPPIFFSPFIVPPIFPQSRTLFGDHALPTELAGSFANLSVSSQHFPPSNVSPRLMGGRQERLWCRSFSALRPPPPQPQQYPPPPPTPLRQQ